jgi:predicted Kef-type K+ transport protein
MDIIWIIVAFVFGMAVKHLHLPPLVGYLLAGFALNFYGIEPDPSLEQLANLGITLMLFTVGLKLNIKDLLKADPVPCVW